MALDLFDKCADNFKPVEATKFGVEPDLECDHVEVCCCRQLDWKATLRQAQGYELPLASRIVKVPPLPKMITAIHGDQSHRPFMRAVHNRTWAVKYQRAITGDLQNSERINQWRAVQGIAEDKWLLFHQESNDKALDSFFNKTYHPNFWEVLRASPRCIFVAPGYSIYDDGSMCRHHQLLNLKRGVDFFVRASEQGLPCIPCLGWNLPLDLERIGAWVAHQPRLKHIAINCQTLRKSQYPKLCRDMALIEQMSRRVTWIVFGGKEAVHHLHRGGFLGRVVLVSAAPLEYAKAGRSMDKAFQSDDPVAIFKRNLEMVEARFE